MKTVIIGKCHFSCQIEKKLKEKNHNVYNIKEIDYQDLEKFICNNDIDLVVNIGIENNINYFNKQYKDSEIINKKIKHDMFIIDICVKYNIKLVYFNNLNSQYLNTEEIFKIYSKEENLNVKVVNHGNILYSDDSNFVADTLQHICKVILYSESSSCLRLEDLQESMYFNTDENLSDIENITEFKRKYEILDMSPIKLSLASITQNVINISNKDVKIVGINNTVYINTDNLKGLEKHIKNTFSKIECQKEIDKMHLSESEIKQIESILENFDLNKDGKLDAKELSSLFSIMNFRINSCTFFKIFEDADKNKDGGISKEEFILLMKKNLYKSNGVQG